MYDTIDSKAAVETLDTALKTTELFVYASDKNYQDSAETWHIDIFAAGKEGDTTYTLANATMAAYAILFWWHT